MPQKFLRKYGVAATLPFTLFEADGINFKTDAAHAAGDTKIMKDEAVEVNTANAFTDEGTGYAIVLSATEMEAKRNVVYIIDQPNGAKAWLDDYIVIESYGHADAMHPFDLGADLSGNNVNWKFKSIDITNDAGDGLTCKSTGGNGKGINIVGHGTGDGVYIIGGLSSGAIGLKIVSENAFPAVLIQNASGGAGLQIRGSHAVDIAGLTSNHAILLNGGPSGGSAIRAQSNGGNAHAIDIQGIGSGSGIKITGGATGDGAEIKGGATSGRGMRIYSPTLGNGLDIGAVDGIGLKIGASGTNKQGVSITSAAGHGIEINTSTTGDGIKITAGGGNGINIAASGGHAISAVVTGGTTHSGLNVKGFGPGAGLNIEGGTTGDGINIQGGVGGGHGINAKAGSSSNGHGFTMSGNGTGKDLDALEIDTLLAGMSLIDGKIDIIDNNIDLIIAKLPSGTISDFALTDTIDGVAVSVIFEYMMSMFNGKFNEDDPTPGKKTFFKRNNITELSVVQVDETGRQRVS